MTVQDCGGVGSNSGGQFPCGDDYSPKVRKPYTITKQRERWTGDEHKKFLEALKLYGRAWQRIEEHIGTKTAVQIRSHAQKFFSKVVRESGGSNTISDEPVEIPPPRPKRKPSHPYPRKMVCPVNKDPVVAEQSITSSSLQLSVSGENQSPKSVLSAAAAYHAQGSADSNSPNGSSSPISSCTIGDKSVQQKLFVHPSMERNGSPSPFSDDADKVHTEKLPMKFNLSYSDGVLANEDIVEEIPTHSVKLFGTTILISESKGPTKETPKAVPLNSDEKHSQSYSWNFMAAEFSYATAENSWSHFPYLMPQTSYCVPFLKQNPNSIDSGSDSPFARCTTSSYGGMLLPYSVEENRDKSDKEGSWTGSNFRSVNVDIEIHSPVMKRKVMDIRDSKEKSVRGFVPYKKHMAESATISSTMTCKETETQRV